MARHLRRAPALLPLALLASLTACGATADRSDDTDSPAPSAEPRAEASSAAGRDLPERWDALPTWDFEQVVAELEVGPWSDDARGALGFALLPDDERSIRAAVLLAHGGDASAEVLLAHLEAREPEPERGGDAAEVVAAAALRRFATDARRARLAVLATGPEPHPDLEVRVECGALALDLGERSVVPFLVRVLRAGTPAELEDPGDWEPQVTLAWAKGRASEALARAAGIDDPFDADASWSAQAAAADALLRAAGGPR